MDPPITDLEDDVSKSLKHSRCQVCWRSPGWLLVRLRLPVPSREWPSCRFSIRWASLLWNFHKTGILSCGTPLHVTGLRLSMLSAGRQSGWVRISSARSFPWHRRENQSQDVKSEGTVQCSVPRCAGKKCTYRTQIWIFSSDVLQTYAWTDFFNDLICLSYHQLLHNGVKRVSHLLVNVPHSLLWWLCSVLPPLPFPLLCSWRSSELLGPISKLSINCSPWWRC